MCRWIVSGQMSCELVSFVAPAGLSYPLGKRYCVCTHFLYSWPSLLKTDLQLIKKRVARNPSVLSGRVERVVVGVN